MKELKSLKEIETARNTSVFMTRLYLVLSIFALLLTFYNEEYLVLFIASMGLAILYTIDVRYWDTKEYMTRMFKKLKK